MLDSSIFGYFDSLFFLIQWCDDEDDVNVENDDNDDDGEL